MSGYKVEMKIKDIGENTPVILFVDYPWYFEAVFEVCIVDGRCKQEIDRRKRMLTPSAGHEPGDNRHLFSPAIQNPGSRTVLQAAAEWLRNCDRNHECSSVFKKNWFPTRVIDTNDPIPRLVDGAGLEGQYATLSYRWGENNDFQLKQETEDGFRKGRPLENYPATLRDAIIVTKALGIRYIWIDALCIFQDEDKKDDWADQAAEMGYIYKGSAVTIAAASASDFRHGFLHDRTVDITPLDWKNGEEPTPKVFLRQLLRPAEIDNASQSDFNERGWILQEMLLSPRLLVFGRDRLYFECHEEKKDEVGFEYENPWDRYKSQIRKTRHGYINSAARMHAGRSFVERLTSRFREDRIRNFTIAHPWNGMLKNYNLRVLTEATDVLTALSGVSREFQRSSGYRYVAGLWKEDIIANLHWVGLSTNIQSWYRSTDG